MDKNWERTRKASKRNETYKNIYNGKGLKEIHYKNIFFLHMNSWLAGLMKMKSEADGALEGAELCQEDQALRDDDD